MNVTLQLKDGRSIENVMKVNCGRDGLLNIHNDGFGYRVVDPDNIHTFVDENNRRLNINIQDLMKETMQEWDSDLYV